MATIYCQFNITSIATNTNDWPSVSYVSYAKNETIRTMCIVITSMFINFIKILFRRMFFSFYFPFSLHLILTIRKHFLCIQNKFHTLNLKHKRGEKITERKKKHFFFYFANKNRRHKDEQCTHQFCLYFFERELKNRR